MKQRTLAMTAPARPSILSARWASWLLVVVTLLAFGAVATHDFSPVDDAEVIGGNPKLNPPNFTRQGVLWYWTHPFMGLYVPVTYTIWGLLAKATWKPTADAQGVFVNPHVFHAASLLVHMASVLLVYALLRRLLGRAWSAAAGALLFAVHPLQVETVAWAAGLKDLLFAALSLGALYLYVRGVSGPLSPGTPGERVRVRGSLICDFKSEITDDPPHPNPLPRSTGGEGKRAYFWGIFLLVVAMLCKPTAMVTPLLAAVMDYFILRRSARQMARSVWPWFLVVIPLAIVAKLVQPGAESAPVPILQRPILVGASLAFYLGKLLWPVGLTFGYGWEPVAMLHKGWFRAIAAIPVPLAVLLFLLRKKQPWLTAAGAICVAAMLPVLGFVPFMYQSLSTVADHYMYLAMLGPAMALAWGLSRLPSLHWKMATAGCAIGALLLSALTVRQLRYWRTEESLLQRMLSIAPDNREARLWMGKYRQGRHDYAGAEQQYLGVLALDPTFLPAREALVNVYSFLGRADEAIAQLHLLMDLRAGRSPAGKDAYKDAFFQAGQLAYSQAFWSDAVRYFTEDLKLNPDRADGKRLLGMAREKLRAAVTQATTRPALHR